MPHFESSLFQPWHRGQVLLGKVHVQLQGEHLFQGGGDFFFACFSPPRKQMALEV